MKLLKGKKFGVLGLGISGIESALFLREQGAEVYATDGMTSEDLLRAKTQLENSGICVDLGKHDVDRLVNCENVILSPGIPPHSDIVKVLKQRSCFLMSEIELAYRFFSGKIVGITGTNGKTTSTILATQLLNHFKFNAFSSGNIGNPFIGEIRKGRTEGIAVIELSSFQLEFTHLFHPNVAFLLNCEPDHLNWHINFENYCASKMKIFKNQTLQDVAILNERDDVTEKYGEKVLAKKIFFNNAETKLNLNEDAVLKLGEVFGFDLKEAEEVLKSSKPIEHRLEIVEAEDFLFINDSKSTNPASLKYALENQSGKVILIAGGRNKGSDFSSLAPIISKKVKELILFGESREELKASFNNLCRITMVSNVREAVNSAEALVVKGDVVLFSPGCASFDQFKNYEDRGHFFKDCVKSRVKAVVN